VTSVSPGHFFMSAHEDTLSVTLQPHQNRWIYVVHMTSEESSGRGEAVYIR
jgi:hypothetical protein